MPKPRQQPHVAPVAVLVTVAALGSRYLLGSLPEPLDSLLWKLGWLALCVLGLSLAYRPNPPPVLAELGLARAPWKGIAVTFLATLPLAGMLLSEGPPALAASADRLLAAGLVGPLAEEVLFRGYLFRQLHRRAGWSFLAAVTASALLFGLVQLRTAMAFAGLGVWVGQVATSALAGAFFAWLFLRWGEDLWVPIGMHAFLNLWWEIFAADPTALGSEGANIGRALAIIAMVMLTARFTPPLGARHQGNGGT